MRSQLLFWSVLETEVNLLVFTWQVPEAVHLPAPGRGGERDAAAEGGSRETPGTQASGCRSDQTGAWERRPGLCKEVCICR